MHELDPREGEAADILEELNIVKKFCLAGGSFILIGLLTALLMFV